MPNQTFREGLPKAPALHRLASEILTLTLEEHPDQATDLGLHEWDDAWPDFSRDHQDVLVRRLRGLDRELAAVSESELDIDDWADLATLRGHVALWIDDETVQHPERQDPNLYNAVISSGLLALARGKFGTPEERGQAALARLKGVPGLFEEAQRNVENPPAVFVETAVPQYRGAVPFFEGLKDAFSGAPDGLLNQIDAAAHEAGREFSRFADFLVDRWGGKKTVGDYRLGAERYGTRLGWQEAIEEPLDRILQRGLDELARLHGLFAAAATEWAPHEPVPKVLERLAKGYPEPSRLLDYTAGVLDELKTFCRDRQIVDIPPGAHPAVVETPAFLRAVTFASIVPPGPFEEDARQSFYQVTLPNPAWPPREIREHMETYNPWGCRIISAHEVYPGHHVQYLYLPKARSTTRKIIASGAFVEGWAHYCEEMMVDEGYGDGKPEMRIAAVLEALQRVGRLICGIRLHTGDMTLAEAEQFFVRECYMAPANARREAIRGTMDPFYLVYTWGKLKIHELRAEAKRRWGNHFRLDRFHDRLLGHGFPSLSVLERLMFNGDPS